jgi:CrcB protein
LVAVVAVGGAIGAAARYGLVQAWPVAPPGFPVTTLAVNVSGCLAIGLLLGVERGPVTRAFVGTGVLGGFTTFSTYAVESTSLWRADRPWAAAGYVAVTLACALLATRLGMLLVRRRR